MREAEENIKFKMEIDVLVPIPRTVTRDFTSLKHLRQWQKRNDIDGSLYCFAHREYLLNEKGEWEQFTVIGKQVVTIGTATEKLKYRIAVKMTAADYFRLLTRSHEAGVSPSEYMRECFRNGHVKERLSEEHAGYIRQLCGMANNLNQLARKANAGGFHDERWDCKVAVARIHELITKIGI